MIARVNGHALGGGAGLVAIADIAVAVSGARFGFTEARLGLIPATISPYVLRKIGPGHAKALFTPASASTPPARSRSGSCTGSSSLTELEHAVADAMLAYLACGPEAIAASKQLVRDATGDAACPTCRNGSR